jgi:hypothetical protein
MAIKLLLSYPIMVVFSEMAFHDQLSQPDFHNRLSCQGLSIWLLLPWLREETTVINKKFHLSLTSQAAELYTSKFSALSPKPYLNS